MNPNSRHSRSHVVHVSQVTVRHQMLCSFFPPTVHEHMYLCSTTTYCMKSLEFCTWCCDFAIEHTNCKTANLTGRNPGLVAVGDVNSSRNLFVKLAVSKCLDFNTHAVSCTKKTTHKQTHLTKVFATQTETLKLIIFIDWMKAAGLQQLIQMVPRMSWPAHTYDYTVTANWSNCRQ